MEEVQNFLRQNCTPPGFRYTLVMASITKRILQTEIPAEWRFKFLDHLNRMTDGSDWCTVDVIAAVEPMDDNGHELFREAQKLGPKKALDVYADIFPTFAQLNPSLIAALKKSPRYAGERQ
jgi:hypothetical protein